MNLNLGFSTANLGKSFFANLANVFLILFVYFWASNYSPTDITSSLKIPAILIIFFSFIQLFFKSFINFNNTILEQFVYLLIISVWILVIVTTWKSAEADLIVVTNFAISSLIFINALIPKNLQLLNFIFFTSILFLTGYFSLTTNNHQLTIVGSCTITLCFFSLVFSYIIFNQYIRRKNSSKRLDILLRELSIKKKEIEQKGLKQSQFLASINHDLKQPMHAINLYLGSVERILLNIKMPETKAQKSSLSLKKLKQSVNYMNNVLDSLLEASRLEQGVSNVKLTNININQFFKRITYQHLKNAQELGLKLEFVSNVKDSLTITSDLRLLERIFRNLLNNAIKYTKKGGVRIRVKEEHSLIKLSVIDTGSGIHPTMKRKIFEEFTQIENTKFQTGIGLGLAIVKKLSGKIGAYVKLNSHLGIGSIFTLFLPKNSFAHRVQTVKTNVIETGMLLDILPQVTTTDINQTIVLVVDQDDDTRNAYEVLSPNLGINFITGITSENVIAKTLDISAAPQLLVVDAANLIEDTLSTIKKVYEEFNNEFPVLLLTEDIENESVAIKNNEKITILQKPFSISKLQLKIKKILAKKV